MQLRRRRQYKQQQEEETEQHPLLTRIFSLLSSPLWIRIPQDKSNCSITTTTTTTMMIHHQTTSSTCMFLHQQMYPIRTSSWNVLFLFFSSLIVLERMNYHQNINIMNSIVDSGDGCMTRKINLPFSPVVVTAIRITPSIRQQDHYHRNLILSSLSQSPYGTLNTTSIDLQEQQIRRETTTTTESTTTHSNRNTKGGPVYVPIPESPDEHFVTSLPLLNPNSFTSLHWAGHLPATPVNDGDKYFFYWLFAPPTEDVVNDNNDEIPLIIWLNGGPACSSMDGLWIENGPFRIVIDTQTNQYKIEPDQHYSWHLLPAYVLYIDQPVGTGLSFTTSHTYPQNDNEVNIDFYHFLQHFFTVHADKFVTTTTTATTGGVEQLTLNRPLYFSGESYAGHYIPSIINYLTKRNYGIIQSNNINNNDANGGSSSSSNSVGIRIPVTGAAIGNGWIDPFFQYAGAEFAYGHGIIDYEQWNTLNEKEKECQTLLNSGRYRNDVCFDLIDDIVDISHGSDKSKYTVNSYDVRANRLRDSPRTFPPGHKVLETYLGGWPLDNRIDTGFMVNTLYQDVLHAIHASALDETGRKYTECTDPPYEALASTDGKGVVDDVTEILNHKYSDNNDVDDISPVRLLFFNGIHDIVCNHVGNEKLLQHLTNWDSIVDYKLANRYVWYHNQTAFDNGSVSGYMKEYGTLQFLKLLDAGHMVPLDIPDVAFHMMSTFITSTRMSQSKDNNHNNIPNPEIGTTFQTDIQDVQNMIEEDDENNQNCVICPHCYARDSSVGTATTNCDTSTTNNNENENNELSALGTFIISYAWVVAGTGIILFLIVMGLVRSSRRQQQQGIQYNPVLTTSNINGGSNHEKSFGVGTSSGRLRESSTTTATTPVPSRGGHHYQDNDDDDDEMNGLELNETSLSSSASVYRDNGSIHQKRLV